MLLVAQLSFGMCVSASSSKQEDCLSLHWELYSEQLHSVIGELPLDNGNSIVNKCLTLSLVKSSGQFQELGRCMH